MLRLEVDIDDLEVSTSLNKLEEAMNDLDGIHNTAALAIESDVKERLKNNYVPRRRRGNFWERVHNSIEVTSDDKQALVSLVELGIGLRYHGGDVRPGVNPARSGPNKGNLTKALAVPSNNVVIRNGRQVSPHESGILAYLRNKGGGDTVGYLVEGEEKTRKRDTKKGKKGSKYTVPKSGGNLLYTLRSITRHKADKKILPEKDALLSSATKAITSFIDSFED